MAPLLRMIVDPLRPAAVLATTAALIAQAPTAPSPVEFGAIAWQRDFHAASAAATAAKQPLLVLFQEVPG